MQPAALRVLRDLGVADLDDVGAVRAVALQRALHLVADPGPLLDADVQVEVGVVGLEALGEPLQEVLRGAALHQPHGHGAPVAPAVLRDQAAAAEYGGGHTDKGEEATSHEGSF